MNRLEKLTAIIDYIDGRPECAFITTCPTKFIGTYTLQTEFFPGRSAAADAFLKLAVKKGWLSYQRHQVGTGFFDVVYPTYAGRQLAARPA